MLSRKDWKDNVNSSAKSYINSMSFMLTVRSETESVNEREIIISLRHAFEKIGKETIPETLPAYILEEFKLPNLRETLTNLHMPNDLALVSRAQFRIKFEEFTLHFFNDYFSFNDFS